MTRTQSKAQRLAELPALLRLKPRTTRELAERYDVPVRTIQRDLDTLRSSGHLLDSPSRGRYFIHADTSALNPVEALAVHVAVRLLYHHSPTRNHFYRSALEKLAALLPEPAREIAAASAQDLRVRSSDDRALEFVARAWFEGRVLAFDYRSPTGSGQWRPKELEVYFIEVSRDNLATYAIGYERSFHKRVLTWKLSRMKNTRLLGDAYLIPEDFDPTRYLATAWSVMGTSGGPTVSVQLRFEGESAERILEGGYPNMTVKQAGDAVLAEVVVGTDDDGFPLEILSWVRSWGPQVEVLGPETLRVRWLEDAKKLTTLHDVSGA